MTQFYQTICKFLFQRIRVIKIILLTVAGGILFTHAHPQSSQYKFEIKIQIDNDRTNSAPNFSLKFDNALLQANTLGIIFFTPASNSRQVKIEPVDEREYMIIGADVIPLPADPSLTTTIIVRKPTNKDQALKEYNKSLNATLKKLNITANELDSLKSINRSLYEQATRLNDSILKIITQHYKISEKDLKTAKEIMDGRERYFNEISSSLEGYVNEGKDVKDVYKTILAFSLENPFTFKQLDSIVPIYNKFYNLLNNNYREYEAAITSYWQSSELSLAFHNVYDFAINNIHKAAILPLNDAVTLKMNQYIHEKNKRKREELKESLANSLTSIIPTLDNNLNILDSKVKEYILRLEMQKDILPQ
jgi:hypothetical protein